MPRSSPVCHVMRKGVGGLLLALLLALLSGCSPAVVGAVEAASSSSWGALAVQILVALIVVGVTRYGPPAPHAGVRLYDLGRHPTADNEVSALRQRVEAHDVVLAQLAAAVATRQDLHDLQAQVHRVDVSVARLAALLDPNHRTS